MNNREYWFKRAQQHDKEVYKSVVEMEKELKKLYSEALDEIMKDFESYAQRYGMNYKSLWKEASKLDQKEFKKYVEENVEKLRMNSFASEEMVDRFFPAYDPAKVNRNAMIYKQLSMRVAPLAYAFEETLQSLLKNIYISTLLRNKYDFAKKFNVSSPIYKFDDKMINEIMTYKWSGENFSTRIWANTDDLRYVLQQEFVKATIKGESIPKLAKTIGRRMSSSYQDAVRLVNTEAAYFDNKASIDSYAECKLEKYEYLSTLDSRTSDVCKGLDGKVFNVKDAVPGVNYPPMHVHCRSTTIPYFEDDDKERIARDSNGKNMIVDGTMTYKEYEKLFLNL